MNKIPSIKFRTYFILHYKDYLKRISAHFPGKYPFFELSDGLEYIDYKKYPMADYPLYETDQQEIQRINDEFNEREEVHFIIKFSNARIEPVFEWVFVKNKIFFDCFIHKDYVPFPNKFLLFLLKLIFWRRKRKNVISLLEPSSSNYCHFYQEVMIRLIYLTEVTKIDLEDYDIVVSNDLYYSKFFHEFIDLSPKLKKLHFICLNNRHLFCENLYIIRPPYDFKFHINKVFDYVPARPGNDQKKRIFLTRNLKKTARKTFVTQYEKILEITNNYGFETVDSGELSLLDQIEIFQNTRYLIAIHGAGETNILWRRDRELSVLELFDPFKIDIVFNRWCRNNNYNYDAIVGRTLEDKIHFQIDIDILQLKIEKMLTIN